MKPSGQPRPRIELPARLAPLGYRNFALYWLGNVISNSGRWMEVTGVVWLVSELTGSAILLGLLGVFRAVPVVVAGPLAGVIVDRVDQRRLLFVTQAVALVASLALGLVVLSGAIQLWMVYVQVAIQATVEAFDAAVRQALFPRLVPRTLRAEAVTLNATAGRTAKFIGPAIAGLAIASLGMAAPFLLNAGTFLSLMVAVVMITGVLPRTATLGSSFRTEMAAGLRYIVKAPVLSGLMTLEFAFALFGVNAVAIAIIGRQVLGVGPEGLGGLLAAPGLGAVLGLSYLLIAGPAKRQGRFVIVCTIAYAVTVLALAVSHDYVVSFLALVVTGLFDVLVAVTRWSVIMLTVPGQMRGRIAGNVLTVTNGLSQLSQTQSGALSGAIGGPLALIAAAAAVGVTAGATALGNRSLWRFCGDEPTSELADAPILASLRDSGS